MKNIVLLLLLVISVGLQAQSLGDHLNYIKSKEPSGNLETNPKGGYVYSYVSPETGSLKMYFLDEDLICEALALKPPDAYGVNTLVKLLNKDWVKQSDDTWLLYRSEDVMTAHLDYVEGVGRVFYFTRTK